MLVEAVTILVMGWSRTVGLIMMLSAVLGGVAVLIASGQLRTAADERVAAIDESLAASTEALRTADDTVAIVASVVERLAGSLVAVEDAAVDSIATLDDAENGLSKLAEISGEDLPRIVESLQEAMPALIQVADVIDGTLGTLSIVGVPYDPDVPFDESLAGVAESIENLPEQVREQAALIEEVGVGLGRIADQGGDLIIEIGLARQALGDGSRLLDRYRAATAAAIADVEAERESLGENADRELSAFSWLTSSIALAQFGLLAAGAVLVSRKVERPAGGPT